MKNLKDEIRNYIEVHTEEMLADITELCSIPSVRSEAKDGMPYGENAYKALMAADSICRKHGFTTKGYSDRVIAADMNDGESCLDILGHMDVVPEGEGWTKTNPFEPIVIDGAIYGRGTSDDKGPSVAALYAMKAIKELGIPVKKNCRLILGSDEECGSSDIPYYYAVEQEAPMTFSPDAEFPLINIEKGQFRGNVNIKVTGEITSDSEKASRRLISFESGDTINIVPNKAFAELSGFAADEISKAVEDVRKEIADEFEAALDEKDGIQTLCIQGESAHASTPEKGVNAAVIMLAVLAKLPFANDELSENLQLASKLFPYGDHEGKAVLVAREDEISGKTSLSPNIMRADEKGISIRFDARTCVSTDEENTILPAKAFLEEKGCEFDYSFVKAHAVDGNSEFVQTLLACYEEVTGLKGECLAIGGGTYVHELKNGVAFGAIGATTDTHMHGADEFMPIKELQDAAVIYALAIAKLCK